LSQKGQGAERQLVNWLVDHGYKADLTRASRGPFDIMAYRTTWWSRERWLIQVKATNEKAISISRDEARDLLSRAIEMEATCAFGIRFGRPIRWRIYAFDRLEKAATRTRRFHPNDCNKLEKVFRRPGLF
jgi:Holliday junction resolvase